tara:strand:+ start:1272 stop:1727 length:456 start_codon:yes stop_codon:yes gene_type:complete
MENYEEEDLEVIEDTGSFIEKKKIHARKGQPPTDIQLANLAKGRELRKQKAVEKIEEKAKAVILKKPELVRQLAQTAPPQDDKPPKPKKKNKQVIIFQDESSSDEEQQQIIIKRKKPKSKPVLKYESSSEEEQEQPPPQPPQQPQIRFRRY